MNVSARSKVLFVSGVLPDSKGSGASKRAHHWVKDLCEQHQVHILLLEDGYAGSDPRCKAVESAMPEVVFHRVRLYTKTPRWLRFATILLPFLVFWNRRGVLSWLCPQECLDECRRIAQIGFKRIIAFRFLTHDIACAVASLDPGTAGVELDLDDLESSTHRSIARIALRRRRWRKTITHGSSAIHYWLLERQLLGRQCVVYLACGDDAAGLPRSVAASRLAIRNNHVEPSASTEEGSPKKRTEATLLFIGLLSYLPNEDAALWLAETLCPLLRHLLPMPFTVVIAGRGASPNLVSRLRKVSEVQYQGEVDEVGPLYRTADIALVPLRGGGGTKLKLLEAVAHSTPVIATQHSVRGTPFSNGRHVFVAESALEFATACARLLSDADSRQHMVEGTEELVRQGERTVPHWRLMVDTAHREQAQGGLL